MRIYTLLFLMFSATIMYAQNTGSIVGKLIDKEYNNEPLPFANILIKGTTTGTTSDFDGLYAFENLTPGSYTLIFSFVGYETQEITVTVETDKVTEVNVPMAASAASLSEVIITTTTRKESEVALLLEQKKALEIKESIGAERLSEIGVSDAAGATTKISGVTKSEGSGDVYIRGLGDRYLSTSMNGLPIPSDDVNNKNINLNLFTTNIIENIGISKTYTTSSYADQASGNVDVVSKKYSKKGFSIGISSGLNTAVTGLDGDFKKTIISDDATFGFHQKEFALVDLITNQGWDPLVQDNTTNFGISLNGAYKFDVFGKEVKLFGAASHGQSFEYREGMFRSYRANIEDNGFPRSTANPSNALNNVPDVQDYYSNINTTAYLRGDITLSDNHTIGYNHLFVNKSQDRVYEAGRNGLGYVFDQQPQENGAFIRDQNFKQTTMFVNQLMGEHKLSERNTLNWADGYNFVLAEEPNRIRNEANILNPSEVTYAYVGGFQQRKSSQKIEDFEYNGYIQNAYEFGKLDEDENRPLKLNVGGDFRYKERDFKSQFIGVNARDFIVPNVDSFTTTFTSSNFNTSSSPELKLIEQQPDIYNADLTTFAGYANLDFGLNKRLSGNVGVRFERDEINVAWNVKNFIDRDTGTPRIGILNREYTDIYPSINLKYALNEKQFLRLASSITQTLPEFKEFAPFEYVSPTGRVIKGNPELVKSAIFNIDAKWEFFPSSEELFSATAFYKNIQDPLNLAQARGSAGIFQYYNTGDAATVFGLEFEGRVSILENEDEKGILNLTANVTQMWFNQDLYEEFQYFNKTESDLQGASDFILNGSLSYNSRKENEFIATLTGNYSSDKIYALGSPEDLQNSATLFNDEIIEKGFVTLDMVVSKQFNKNLSLKLSGKNLLNPSIEQAQQITIFDVNDNIVSSSKDVVQSYKKGSQFSLGLTYKF
ncbi:TonB-dependent receptor [Pontimicrobium aquaticum]|uniref:TonB-dependent receptor n=1 Tax=Pontimicrobium aquaticum TaxID=2565367 RepID=A0A4U0ESD6_9FLAO|nr:TonB-dependent receptor [Pontimicrobium aquaticum]TJY34631.1 TonB-dependent receptor [Pontimicrobium aquaticum]